MMSIIVILFCSCSKGEKMKISDPQKNVLELLTDEYSEEQLDNIDSFANNFDALNDEFPVQCIRKNESGYQVIYRSTHSILIVYFDLNYNKTFSRKFSALMRKSEFDVISIGQSIDEVRDFDSNGDYLFLYTGRADFPKISSHYTSDGYLIEITYDDAYRVTNINSQLV